MATTILYQCPCGKRYSFFITKQLFNGEIMQQEGDWAEVDAQEAADGEIELTKATATAADSEWVDVAKSPGVLCDCGEFIEPIETFKKMIAEGRRNGKE
jgi:UTP-glucose-1-phosphate uridylyltransferase